MSDHDAGEQPMERKRANGTGSVEVRGDGTARLRLVVRGKRTSRTFASEERAHAMLAAINDDVSNGAVEAPGGPTFGQVFTLWIDARELSRRVRGIDEERTLARARVEPAPFWNTPIRAVRRRDLTDWIDALLASHARQPGKGGQHVEAKRTLSSATVAKALQLVRLAFAHAVEREILAATPAAGVKVPRVVRPCDVEDAWTFLSADEIATLLGSDLSERDRALYTFAIYAGPRQGEAFSLRWEDVHEGDEQRPRVVIRRGRTGATKSGKTREVPLFAPARESFARWREQCGGAKARGLVFPNADGDAYDAHYDGGWFDKRQRVRRATTTGEHVVELVTRPGVKSRAGIARDVRFHDLRHTCASHLVMGTWGRPWRLDEVRAFLGHSTVRMTERYAHLAPDALHAAARATAAASPPSSSNGGASPVVITAHRTSFGDASRRLPHGCPKRTPTPRDRSARERIDTVGVRGSSPRAPNP
jgi:integrase